MAVFSPALAARIAGRHGIVSRAQLIGDGFTDHSVRWHVSKGLLDPVHKGVYRLASSPDTFESRCVAASTADPWAIVTGVAAARLWDFHHVWRPEIPHLLVGHSTTPLAGGVILRRSNCLDRTDVVQRPDGIRVASPPRAWFDCARDIDDERFERLTEWVLDHHATVPTLWSMARRLQAKGRPGMARVHRVMSRRADWQKPAGSALELRVLAALERNGIELVRQHPLRLRNGAVIHPDGADPILRWAVEVDHVTWHGGRFDAQRDKGRDRAARLVGWQIERVTDQELTDDFAGTIAELVHLHRERRRANP